MGYTNGDGIVPFESADAVSAPLQNKFYFRNADHAQMPSAEKVRAAIVSMLTDKNIETDKDFANSTEHCGLKGKQLSWRSPVEVHVYDSSDRHTGLTSEGIEYGIPGVMYEIVDSHKFMFLPTDEGQNYRVEAKGQAEGSFDLVIQNYR